MSSSRSKCGAHACAVVAYSFPCIEVGKVVSFDQTAVRPSGDIPPLTSRARIIAFASPSILEKLSRSSLHFRAS